MSNNDNILSTNKIDTVNVSHQNTKVLYIVVTEDPTVKSKARYFVAAQKVVVTPTFLELFGYEVKEQLAAQIKSIQTFEDALGLAKKEGSEIENVKLPWHRVIRINEYKLLLK